MADRSGSVQVSASGFLAGSLINLNSSEIRITLVNINNTLARPPEKISHCDIFNNFTVNAPAVTGKLEVFCHGEIYRNVERITANSPEFSGGKDLHFTYGDNILTILVEPETFAGFLEINLFLKR